MIDDWMLLQKHLSSWLVHLLNIFRFCAANHSQMKKNFSSTKFLSGTFGAPTKIWLSTLLKHHLNVANHLQPHFSATFFVSLPSKGMKDLSPALDHPLESPSQSRMDLLSIGTSPAWVQKESCTWKRFTVKKTQGPSPFHKKGKRFLGLKYIRKIINSLGGCHCQVTPRNQPVLRGANFAARSSRNHEDFYTKLLLRHPKRSSETSYDTWNTAFHHWCLNFLLVT